jgi:palmitoyltransferase
MFFLFTFGMFLTTFYNMAINYTTVEILQKGGVYNVALLKPRISASSTPYSSTNPSPNPNQQNPVLCELQRSHSRSYIVVQTQPGDNPWDMGAWKNVRSIMGESVIGWFIPWTMSPIVQHDSHEGEFGWGKVVQRMMEEHGVGRKRSRRRSRGSRSESRTEPRPN